MSWDVFSFYAWFWIVASNSFTHKLTSILPHLFYCLVWSFSLSLSFSMFIFSFPSGCDQPGSVQVWQATLSWVADDVWFGKMVLYCFNHRKLETPLYTCKLGVCICMLCICICMLCTTYILSLLKYLVPYRVQDILTMKVCM